MSFTSFLEAKRVPATLGIVATAIAIVLASALLPPLHDPKVFLRLVDTRSFLGIPNFLNVVSNIPFLLVGVWGLYFLADADKVGKTFEDARERWPYLVCFLAVSLTCFGSIYYHLAIDPAGLFWDRLPMAAGFMALFSAVIVERVSTRVGLRLLLPLVLLGIASVLYWRWGLLGAPGNILPYALVQYGSIAAILFICATRPSRYTRGADTAGVIAIYGLAKVAEVLDAQVYALGEIVSGHTLKHLIAAFAVYWLLRMLRLRSPRAMIAQGRTHTRSVRQRGASEYGK
jgi:hypothetical protein